MEKHTVDLETAKKLAKYLPKGFKSKFIWFKEKRHDWDLALHREAFKNNIYFYSHDETRKGRKGKRIYSPTVTCGGWEWEFESIYPAPTLSEMLELLPRISIDDKRYCWMLTTAAIFYTPLFRERQTTGDKYLFEITESQNPATAAARVFMYLVDNGHISKEGE